MKGFDEEEKSSFKDLKKRQDEFVKLMRADERAQKIRERRFQNENSAPSSFEVPLTTQADPSYAGITPEVLNQLMNAPVAAENLETYLSLLTSDEPLKIFQGIISLRTLLINKIQGVIQTVVEHPSLNSVISLAAQESKPFLRMEALWTLANLLVGSTTQTGTLLRRGILPILFDALKSKYPKIVEHAIWAIGNIASDCSEFRTQVVALDQQRDHQLLKILASGSEEIREVSVWVISSICRLKPNKENIANMEPYIKGLLNMLVSKEGERMEIATDCILGLQNCVKSSVIDLFNQPEIFQRLKVLYHSTMIDMKFDLLSPVHSIIGGLTSGPDEYIEYLLKQNFLSYFTKVILSTKNKSHQKEISWILANVALSKEAHQQALISEPALVDKLLELSTDKDADVATEAFWVFCNLCKGQSNPVLSILMDKGLIQLFATALKTENDSNRLLLALEAIKEVLQAGEDRRENGKNPLIKIFLDSGLADLIEQNQMNESQEVYEKAQSLLETYFETDD